MGIEKVGQHLDGGIFARHVWKALIQYYGLIAYHNNLFF